MHAVLIKITADRVQSLPALEPNISLEMFCSGLSALELKHHIIHVQGLKPRAVVPGVIASKAPAIRHRHPQRNIIITEISQIKLFKALRRAFRRKNTSIASNQNISGKLRHQEKYVSKYLDLEKKTIESALADEFAPK